MTNRAHLKKQGTINVVKSVRDLLESHYVPLLDALESTDVADLSPADEEEVNKFFRLVQRYSEACEKLQLEGEGGVSNKSQGSGKTEEPKEPKKGKKPKKTVTSRRNRSKAYDLLLLEALNLRARYGFPIGQQTLLELATALEPATKKGSLISKLNRWRNDKDWVSWGDSEDISITDAGRMERSRLLPLVQRDGRIDELKQVFKDIWEIDIAL